MKNSLNIVLIALLLVVMGCSCQKIQELAEQANKPEPAKPASTSGNSGNTSSTPKSTPASADEDKPASTGGRELTMAKYDQIKKGMTYSEVVEILGGEGEELTSSAVGKYKVSSYTWSGENLEMIAIVFENDKVSSKTQANLK